MVGWEVYCYRVAGTVGIMTLPVLGFDPMQLGSLKRFKESIGVLKESLRSVFVMK